MSKNTLKSVVGISLVIEQMHCPTRSAYSGKPDGIDVTRSESKLDQNSVMVPRGRRRRKEEPFLATPWYRQL
jgi:hypothetical protein